MMRKFLIITALLCILFCLASCFSEKEPSPLDYKTSRFWTMRAARSGSPQAQAMVGDMFYNGSGEGKDLKKAWAWYKLAAERGNPSAVEMLPIVASNLSPKDFEKAQEIFSKIKSSLSTN